MYFLVYVSGNLNNQVFDQVDQVIKLSSNFRKWYSPLFSKGASKGRVELTALTSEVIRNHFGCH